MVCEFKDVFPEELPRLPPLQEIDFKIELLQGAQPISKAPYRMASTKHKELNIQFGRVIAKGIH